LYILTKDPIDSTSDTENTQGNILTALLNFPVVYTFHVVGRTSGDESLQSIFIEQVKDVINQFSSTATTLLQDNNNKNDVVYHIVPRGTKFTKISIQKEVINAQEIAFIYDQLSKLDLSIMQF
jgi:putative lipoic acid-binding regulatory protein